MKPKCYCTGWPLVAALAASVLVLPSLAGALTLDEALRLAETNAPSLTAQAAKLQAASSAAIPAGELPDPKLLLGVQNYPIGGPDRWRLEQDFMTMQMVGVMQEVPSSWDCSENIWSPSMAANSKQSTTATAISPAPN